MSTKTQQLQEKIAAVKALAAEMDASVEANTPENRGKADEMLADIAEVKAAIEREAAILGAESFLSEPGQLSKTAGLIPAGGDGANAEPFLGSSFSSFLDLGRDLIDSEGYKAALAAGIPRGSEIVVERKGYLNPSVQMMEARDAMQRSPSEGKATLTSAGLTSIQWLPGVYAPMYRLTVADLLAQGRTGASTIRYMQETAFTNAATTVAEGAAKPEATFTVVEKDAPVKKIAVTAKVTDELFADYPAMRDYVNERLRLMLGLTEENQLLNGLGTGSEITGIVATAGIQTHPLGATGDTTDVAIFKGANMVRNIGMLEPDGIVLNPTDWEKLRLLQDANKQYYAGGPFSGTYGQGGYVPNPPLWGLTVVVTPAQVAGTALVGAFKTAAQVFYRDGVRVDMTNSNVDDFVKNLLTIRCEERLALAVYRPKGFCLVTGI